MIRIKNYANRFEAEMELNILEANGIRAVAEADDAGGVRPDLMMSSGGVWLLVKEADKEKANTLLNG